MPKKLIVITVFDGNVQYVDKWDKKEMEKLHPNEVYFGKKLCEGIDYIVFNHDRPRQKQK